MASVVNNGTDSARVNSGSHPTSGQCQNEIVPVVILRFALAPPARCRPAAAKWRFGRVPRPRGRLQADRFRIPRAERAGALLLSARKQMQKGHPRVAFFTFVFLAERGGFEPPIGYEPIHAFQACDLNHSSISPASPAFGSGRL